MRKTLLVGLLLAVAMLSWAQQAPEGPVMTAPETTQEVVPDQGAAVQGTEVQGTEVQGTEVQDAEVPGTEAAPEEAAVVGTEEAAVVDTGEGEGFVLTAGPFFVTIIGGLILALAFQLVLTNLSLAAGLSAAGAATNPDKRRQAKAKKAEKDREHPEKAREEEEEGLMEQVHEGSRKVTAGIGIWALVTATISLFFASWLAVEMSRILTPVVGALMGLTVWGLFYVIMTSLEASAVTSLIGSVVSTAKSGMRSAYEAGASLLGRSPEKKEAAASATEMAKAVREEILGGETLKQQMRDYFGRMENTFSPQRIRKELAKLLDSTEIEYLNREGGEGLNENELVASIHSGGGLKPEQAKSALQSIKDAIQNLRVEAASGKDRPTAAVGAALRSAGMSGEQAEQAIHQVEDYLRSTGKQELNPEGIKRDLERMLHDPKGGMEALRGRLSGLDRQTITGVLSQRTDMSQEEAGRVVDTVMGTLQTFGIGGGGQAGGQGGGIGAAVQGKVGDIKERVTGKLRDYLDSLGRPEMQYEDVKEDFQKLFENPKEGAEALVGRLKSLNQDDIKAILSSNKNISEEDADRIVNRVIEARDSVVQKADEVKREVQKRLAQAKEEALHQADEARKTVSTAAWWALLAAVVSGAAAAIGGMMPYWTA